MKGLIEIVRGLVNTKITIQVTADPIEGGVATSLGLGVLVPNEQWGHLILQEAIRIECTSTDLEPIIRLGAPAFEETAR